MLALRHLLHAQQRWKFEAFQHRSTLKQLFCCRSHLEPLSAGWHFRYQCTPVTTARKSRFAHSVMWFAGREHWSDPLHQYHSQAAHNHGDEQMHKLWTGQCCLHVPILQNKMFLYICCRLCHVCTAAGASSAYPALTALPIITILRRHCWNKLKCIVSTWKFNEQMSTKQQQQDQVIVTESAVTMLVYNSAAFACMAAHATLIILANVEACVLVDKGVLKSF